MTDLNILVTGSEGFIGRHLCNSIIKQFPSSNIIGVGSQGKQAGNNHDYKYIPCDLLDLNSIAKLPKDVDILIHLAGDGRPFVNPLEYTPQLISNIIMTSNVADYALLAGVKLIIYASSVYVYSGSQSPFKEEFVQAPVENLGTSKLGDELLLKTRSLAGLYKTIALRLFTVYGPGSKPKQFIPESILKIKSSNPNAKFHSPDILRDFIYIDDVVSAIISSIHLINHDIKFETLNVGTGIGTSIKEVILILVDLLESKKNIDFIDNSDNNNIDINHIADLSHIKNKLNWQPNVSLRRGLRKVLDNF